MDDPDIEPLLEPLSLIFSAGFVLDAGILPFLIVFLILLFLTALISASEVAFFSLTPSQIRDLRKDNDQKIPAIVEILDSPKVLHFTIMVTNNLMKVILILLAVFISDHWLLPVEPTIWHLVVFILVTAGLILTFGEIAPRFYATSHNLKVVRSTAVTMAILIFVFKPLSRLLLNTVTFLEARFQKGSGMITMDEISEAIDRSSDPSDQDEEKKLLKGIVKFSDIEVNEVMTPRIDVTATDEDAGFGKVLSLIVETGYSRIPVYSGNLDKITGILYVKELLPYSSEKSDFQWNGLVRPALFVPESKKINDLLEDFQKKKIHMAIVVDEYGGTSGIVTLEDILEEIVGEISDEFDTPADSVEYVRIDDHNYIFEGKTSVIDFCKLLNLNDEIFDSVKGNAESLAGLVIELMGRIPQKNESVVHRQFIFKVESADNRRVKRIRVTLN